MPILTDPSMLVSYASVHLTPVPTAHLIQFACRWRNSILSATFLFPFKENVYSQLPSEKDRPSLGYTKNDDGDKLDKANRKIPSSAGRVRAEVTCGSIFIPPTSFTVPSNHCHQSKSILL